MMNKYYTSERNVQIVIALMKAHGIKRVIASPGTTNITLVASIQQDPFFDMYSAADERSAAYIACGLAAETGEPVALSCTGATASRNYMPGLTEAYYRKLPVLAITSGQHFGRVANGIAQVIDRSVLPKDIVRISVLLPTIHGAEDEWACEVLANRAILELRRAGGGPAHINLITTYSSDFSVKLLPSVRVINRIFPKDEFPELPAGKKIAVFVGAHGKWKDELTQAVDAFCSAHDAVVFCDQTSNYRGKYRVLHSLAFSQQFGYTKNHPDLVIHIGRISGDYSFKPADHSEVWRVDPDGAICDTFQKLRYVFEMDEIEFFNRHTSAASAGNAGEYLSLCRQHLQDLHGKIPEIPFSNIWIASRIASRIPAGSIMHFGILNSLRSWNFFETPASVLGYSNTGGFGIDGCVSSLIGASLADRKQLFFGIFGDLAFFYDMNSLGNRHIGPNIRILLVNNGKGTEFRNFNHPGSAFGDIADNYIAAAGHYGKQSRELVKHYAEDLGFEYLAASSKEEFENTCQRFLVPEVTGAPMLFEVFTDSREESDALEQMILIEKFFEKKISFLSRRILGPRGVRLVRKMMGK